LIDDISLTNRKSNNIALEQRYDNNQCTKLNAHSWKLFTIKCFPEWDFQKRLGVALLASDQKDHSVSVCVCVYLSGLFIMGKKLIPITVTCVYIQL